MIPSFFKIEILVKLNKFVQLDHKGLIRKQSINVVENVIVPVRIYFHAVILELCWAFFIADNCVGERGTNASKINDTPKGVHLPISKIHSILAVANLLAHNNKSQICTAVKFHYRVLQLTAVFLTI